MFDSYMWALIPEQQIVDKYHKDLTLLGTARKDFPDIPVSYLFLVSSKFADRFRTVFSSTNYFHWKRWSPFRSFVKPSSLEILAI